MGMNESLPARVFLGIEQRAETRCEAGIQGFGITRKPEMNVSRSQFDHGGSLGETGACVMEF